MNVNSETSAVTLPSIGFLGPGAMGSGMILRLLEAGYRVSVWARNPAKTKPLIQAGATPAASPKELVQSSDIVVGCLLDSTVIRAVYLGPDGVAESVQPNQLVVEHATFEPAISAEISRALAERGATFADAPVSGGPRGARDGTLVAMVGAGDAVFDALRPVLSSYCARLVHVGAVGSGLKLKLVNQFLVSVHAVAAAEAAALVNASGIDPEMAHQALTGGWAASAMLDLQLTAACAGNFEGDGAFIGGLIEVQRLLADFASTAGVQSSLLDRAREAFGMAVNAGHAEHSMAALVTNYEDTVSNADSTKARA